MTNLMQMKKHREALWNSDAAAAHSALFFVQAGSHTPTHILKTKVGNKDFLPCFLVVNKESLREIFACHRIIYGRKTMGQ